ncbi:MAG: TolC family protein, partial [Rikenellaceae bacterium]
YDEGYISKGDLLMIEARLSEAEYSLTSAEQSRQTAQNNLNVLRGVDPSVEVSLSDIRPDSMSLPLRATIEEVIMRRPDYEALRLTELAAEAATKAVRGVYNPQLYGGVSGSWRSNTPNYTGSTTIDGAVFVELSVPIFHFGERRKAVAASRKSEQISAINSSILLDSITGDESNAWVSVVESRAQMSAAARSLQIASENLDISTYSYNEGEVSIVELLTAQISWIQIYTNAIDSEYRYQIALAYYGFVAAQ